MGYKNIIEWMYVNRGNDTSNATMRIFNEVNIHIMIVFMQIEIFSLKTKKLSFLPGEIAHKGLLKEDMWKETSTHKK